MNDNEVSVIITANRIPSHPKITVIQQVIESLKLIKYGDSTVLEKGHIILAHDCSRHEKFLSYIKKLEEYTKGRKNVSIVLSEHWGHLTGNIRNAMPYVKTPYMLIVQHDLPFIKAFDIGTVIDDMKERPELKHIRFNKRSNYKGGVDGNIKYLNHVLFGKQVVTEGNTYTRTPGWSDNNHLCRTKYYTDIVLKEVPNYWAMEKKLNRRQNINNHDRYGMYLYGKLYESPYIKHIDGRHYGNIDDVCTCRICRKRRGEIR